MVGVVGMLALAGCVTNDYRVPVAPIEQRIDASIPIEIEVDNKLGSVEVIADPQARRAFVEARITSALSVTKPNPDTEALARRWISADMRSRPDKRVLRVLSARPAADESDIRVGLVIRVPRIDGIRVRNTGGSVRIVGFDGPVTVQNGLKGGAGGGIDLLTIKEFRAPITAQTTTGDIRLRVGETSTASLTASADKGEIGVASRTAVLDNVKVTRALWSGRINQGANPVDLRTGEGSITVEVGFPYGQPSISGVPAN